MALEMDVGERGLEQDGRAAGVFILESAVGIEDERRKCLSLRRLEAKPCEKLVHPLGEGDLDFKFLPAGGPFRLRGICFLWEVTERAIGSDRRAGKWGLFASASGRMSELVSYGETTKTRKKS
jgi:hypothetical protein